MQKNRGTEKHIAERMRRAMMMEMTWKLWKRILKEDYRRRMKML